jgi:peptide/nickel transport system substrate-binding protein
MLASIDMRDRNNDGIVEDATGHEVVFNLKVAANNQMRVAMTNFIRDDLAQVGIKVVLVPVDFNSLMANINNDFQYDAAIAGFGHGVPDPLTAMNVWRSSDFHPWRPRESAPDSPEQARVDWLVDQIIASTDMAQRKAWWTELHTINNQQGWLIWLPVPNAKTPIRNRFGNVRPSGLSSTASSVVWNAEEFFVKSQGRATN